MGQHNAAGVQYCIGGIFFYTEIPPGYAPMQHSSRSASASAFDDETSLACIGKNSEKTDPLPGSLLKVTYPPSSAASRCVIVSPNPFPP